MLFGTLAGATAYIIFYREYIHHFVDISKARAMALRGAVTAFLLFLGLSVIAGFVISYFAMPQSRER